MSIETIELIIKGAVLIIVAVVTGVIVPYLKNIMGENKFNELKAWAEVFVRCAEQVFTAEEYKSKKRYVMECLSLKVSELGLKMEVKDIEHIVESTVNLVKYSDEYRK